MPVIAFAGLRRLLLLHGLITLLAAIVLIVSPAFIPQVAGVVLPPDANLMAYLLAAAELGLSVLSFGGSRLSDAAALRLIAASCVAFHASSVILALHVMYGQPVNRVLVLNVIARCVIIGLFVALARPRP